MMRRRIEGTLRSKCLNAKKFLRHASAFQISAHGLPGGKGTAGPRYVPMSSYSPQPLHATVLVRRIPRKAHGSPSGSFIT